MCCPLSPYKLVRKNVARKQDNSISTSRDNGSNKREPRDGAAAIQQSKIDTYVEKVPPKRHSTTMNRHVVTIQQSKIHTYGHGEKK
mmetsp:Transcript_40928/g.66378  ORF Transcript_40928/g.66378 Transcript_40928/m.66378 type:complete len:86 (-) Transcript_40928:1457-1714(-)